MWNVLPLYVQCHMLSGLHSPLQKNLVTENVTSWFYACVSVNISHNFCNLTLFIRILGVSTISFDNLSVFHDHNPDTAGNRQMYCKTLQGFNLTNVLVFIFTNRRHCNNTLEKRKANNTLVLCCHFLCEGFIAEGLILFKNSEKFKTNFPTGMTVKLGRGC